MNEDVKIGDHCWALLTGKLLVVLKVDPKNYVIAGKWESVCPYRYLKLLEVIPRPEGHEHDTLFFKTE